MSITVETDVSIPMRDGCLLSADVYRPTDAEPHPTLTHITYVEKRSKYGMALLINPITAAERGFVVVIADCRGTFASQGNWTPFHGHAEDGYDVVEWAARQPWSNGRVGIFGSSGHGVTALQTAVAAPPHLEAAMLVFTGGNYFEGWAYSSGVLELAFAEQWAARITVPSLLNRISESSHKQELLKVWRDSRNDGWKLARHLPLSDDSMLPREIAPWLYEWLEHRTYDSYWESVDGPAHAAEIRCPILQVVGWYDLFMRGQLDLDRALMAHPDPNVRDNSRLIVGPWSHDAYIGSKPSACGERDFGPEADAGSNTVTPLGLEWFGSWLSNKPKEGHLVPRARARYYCVGERAWKEGRAWPPESQEGRLYLHSMGKANSAAGDGVLSFEPPTSEPADSFTYDPRNPVSSVGGPNVYLASSGIQNQSEVEQRDDVLVYTTALLQTAVSIAGIVELHLFAISSAPDTDFTAKLVDVEPDGFCANVAEGIVRLRTLTNDRPVNEPQGGPLSLKIRLHDIAHCFPAGHRIRIEVSSSNFPRFARNLNSTIHPHDGSLDDAEIAIQRVLHDANHPSFVSLPLQDHPA